MKTVKIQDFKENLVNYFELKFKFCYFFNFYLLKIRYKWAWLKIIIFKTIQMIQYI